MDILIVVILPFLLTVIITPILIPFLRKMHFGQSILQIGPKWHNKKQGTPTMGGIAFILSIIISSIVYFIYSGPFNPAQSFLVSNTTSFLFLLLPALAFGLIGFLDDYVKVVKKQNLGLRAWQKFGLQILVSIIFAIYYMRSFGTNIIVPFAGNINIGWWFLPYAVFILVGVSNAVNLTDGVDALVSTLIPISIIALLLISTGISSLIPIIVGSAVLGFLVYNRNPAKIFMGDTGSLFLGGFLAVYAINNPIALLLVGIIYFIETFSVILQVAFFKTTGRRIFKMSPIHHHFEMSGWNEKKIVIIFALVTIIFSILAYIMPYRSIF